MVMRLVWTLTTHTGQRNYYIKDGQVTFCLTKYEDFDEEYVSCFDGKKWIAVNDLKIIQKIKKVIR